MRRKATRSREELSETAKREVAKAVKEIESGRFKTHEQVGKELGLQ